MTHTPSLSCLFVYICFQREREREKEAHRALRKAQREREELPQIQALAATFLSLLRDHSRLKKESAWRHLQPEASLARKQCHQNFWGYAKGLLDGDVEPDVAPSFSALTAQSHFTDTYQTTSNHYQTSSWMPTPSDPLFTMDFSPITMEELTRVIWKARSSSSPSPFNSIPYLVIKRCPSTHLAIHNQFNRVMMECDVPSSWKAAVVKLIPKSAIKTDPFLPGKFHPIALTPAISKLFSSILRDRWLRHMLANRYLDSNIQKAFLPGVSGVSEQQAKLTAFIKTAKHLKRSLAVAWLDIANAHGSVNHALIQFSMEHYHAPQEFGRLLRSWYTGLSSSVTTKAWSTSSILLKIGVYQGDPLSVVIFLTVMNTLSDTLHPIEDLGFSLPPSSTFTNHLMYAGDVCLVSSSPAGCQHLLELVQRWLKWSCFKAKVEKCCALCLNACTGKGHLQHSLFVVRSFPRWPRPFSSFWGCQFGFTATTTQLVMLFWTT